MDASDVDSKSSENDEAEYLDKDSGNGVRHKVLGLCVVMKKELAWFQKN